MKSQKVNQNLKASLLRKRQALFQELFSIMQSELINYLEKSSPPSKTLLTHYHHYLKKKKILWRRFVLEKLPMTLISATILLKLSDASKRRTKSSLDNRDNLRLKPF